MPRYRVVLNGAGFRLEIDGALNDAGFYVTHFVTATDPDAAEAAAIEAVRRRERLRQIAPLSPPPGPRIFLEEIAELGPDDEFHESEQGLAWYLEESGDPETC